MKHINRLGLKIHEEPVPHIKRQDLMALLKREGINEQFNRYFGIQTQYTDGPYPHDVEAVFVRIFDKKPVGTQLYWD